MTETRPKCEAVRMGAGKATLSVIGGVCLSHFVGVVGFELYFEAAQRMAVVIAENDLTAFVIDLGRTVLTIERRKLDGMPADLGPSARGILRIPGAIVTPIANEKTVRAWAWDMAQRGYERAIFTEPLAAWTWAQKRAQDVRLLRLDSEARGFAPSVPSGL